MAKSTKQKSETARTTMILRSVTADEIKFIGMFEHKTMTDIVDDVLTDYIKKWKKEHPNVVFPTTK